MAKMQPPSGFALSVHRGLAVWSGGHARAAIDIWFHPAFGDSHLCFREVFSSSLARLARVFVFDPPGHGASPPRQGGLTVEGAARAWRDLIAHYSASRPVVLAAHSMASVIASRTAQLLRRSPALVISIEGNLTRADAYYTGLATQFGAPGEFYASFRSRVMSTARRSEVMRRFACSLQFADPMTLWTLGRSVDDDPDPGGAFLRLKCPGIYYWDAASSSRDAQAYVERHQLPNRRLDGLGHWPMVKSPSTFYSAVEQDVSDLGLEYSQGVSGSRP